MDSKQVVMLAIQASILCTVFSFGLKATIKDLTYVVRQPGLLARSILAVFVIMPAFAVLLAHVMELQRAVEIVLVALAVSPVPPLLPRRELSGGGHAAFALGLMAWLAVLSIIAVPGMLKLVELYAGRPLTIAPSDITTIVFKSVVFPLAAGMILRALRPMLAEKLAHPLLLIGNVLLPLAVIALLLGASQSIWDVIGQGTLLAMVIFIGTGLAIGHVLALPDAEHSIVLALSTACRHPAIAFTIATTNFPNEHFGATLLLYLLVNALVGALYVVTCRRWVGGTKRLA